MKEQVTLKTLMNNMIGEKKTILNFSNDTPNKLKDKIENIPNKINHQKQNINTTSQINELWLEKYKPLKFCDLLTDEKTNRDILTWMKSWDDIVYGKKFNLPQKAAKLNKGNEFGGSNFNNNANIAEECEFLQSKHKIILISGPPGIGKTTLAKVIANHCGYETIIINASDERTSDKLLSRIYDSTQIHNLNFAKKENQNPTCLILDEIDGVFEGADGKNAIQNIMEFIKNGTINKSVIDKLKNNILKGDKDNFPSNKKESSGSFNKKEFKKAKSNDSDGDHSNEDLDDNDDFHKKRKNKEEIKEPVNKKKNIVKRPIICICNDLYAKVLINMRKEALTFNIKKSNPAKLLNRLKEICVKENLTLDTKALKNLCEKSNYDIRVCINTLEFLSHNKHNTALFKTISNGEKLSILGQKDLTEGVFGIWAKLFSSSLEKTSYNSIMDLYCSHGENNIINDGIFTNYLKVTNKDNDLSSRAKLLDYLSHDDTLQKYINSTFNYEIARFQGIPGAYVKKKFSTVERLNLEFTSNLIEMKKQKKENNQIIKSLKTSYQEENFSLKLSKKNFVLDLLPFLFQLIQPEIREINTDLMNKRELMQLYHSINLMHVFGIKFNNNASNYDPQSISNFETEEIALYEPDIKKLLNFEFNSFKSCRVSHKQKLIIKNEHEKYRNFQEAKKIMKSLNNLSFSSDILDKIKSNKLNLQSNEMDLENRQSNKSYFKLWNKRTFTQMNEQKSKFIYKYNEGVTNSVRRALNISYFMK